jgi:hypothetical protein
MECVVANGDAVLEPGFTDGFVDGFADYLDRGGAGESPPVPPQQYWKVEWANAHGKDVARRYLQGFAQGAAAARASELRQDSVVVVQPPMIYTGLPPSQLPPPVVEPRLPTLPPPLDSKPLLDFKPPATRAPDIEFGPSPRPVIFVSLPDDPAPIGFDRSPVRSYEPDR